MTELATGLRGARNKGRIIRLSTILSATCARCTKHTFHMAQKVHKHLTWVNSQKKDAQRTHNSAHKPHSRARHGAAVVQSLPKGGCFYALRALSGSGVALPGGSCRAAPSRELARYSRGSVVALSGGSCRAAPPRELARYSRGMYGYPRLERASRQRRSVCRTAPTAKPPQQNQCSHWSAAWVGRHSEANVLGGALETLSGSTAALLWGPAGRGARA